MNDNTSRDTSSDAAATSPDGTLLSLAAAASRLGVSESTIRRRVKAGTLPHIQVEQGRRVIWRIPAHAIPDTSATPPGVNDTSGGTNGVTATPGLTPPAVARLLDLVERQQEQVAQLSGQVGFLQAQVQERDTQIKLLQAPPDEPTRRWWRKVWRLGR